MRVPFFRSKQAARGKKAGLALGGLDGIASESDAAYAPATPVSSAGSVGHAAPAKGAPTSGGQVGEMEAFLAQIDGFQAEARRLFPENMALDQILGELRDECRRRVDYMTRVSAPPAWMAHQRNSSSSSTITAARRTQQPPARTWSAAAAVSPASTATSASSSSSGQASPRVENKNNNDAPAAYFSRHNPAATARKPAASPPSSPTNPPARRDARVADHRRRTAPQSMIVAGSAGTAATNNRAAISHAATMSRLPRTSMALPAPLDSPRFSKAHTSSIDNFGRPLSFADAAAADSPHMNTSGTQLNSKGSFGVMRPPTNAPPAGLPKTNKQQHMPTTHSGKAAGEYVFNVKLAGHKIEAAISPSLQTSLISLSLAKIMAMPVTSVPPNSRVWSSGGKSWPVVGEVVGLPFVCGNMTFTHSFKVVHGAAGTNDMSRDIILANDFCVCNHGRIKDNQLHLEQLSMPITVPVRQIPAN
ncbi:hypothetical protein GGI04_002579 [Coemansia thaxteri]|nr:hypothetical protein GGI04_002579 [Coemansia thaxteri]KAJ2469267.1 hypothetical protein GGI02_003447 [Coemansia sp. RSA 2322]KAJ2483361.1 hypothetical protein EV174_002949 [Coemansia sp. RSA 2320]